MFSSVHNRYVNVILSLQYCLTNAINFDIDSVLFKSFNDVAARVTYDSMYRHGLVTESMPVLLSMTVKRIGIALALHNANQLDSK